MESLRELAVNVKSYREYKKYETAYKKAKNKEQYYEQHESQMLLFNAADRYIRSVGLDSSKVTYEQVVEGINKLNAKKEGLKDKQRERSKELRESERQMDVIKEYLGKDYATTNASHKRHPIKDNAR